MLKVNEIYNMECIEGMKIIDDCSVNLICTDLPYGTTNCSWDTVIPFDKLWEQYNRIIKDDGVIILFGTQPFTTDLINSNREMYKHINYWNKENAGSFTVAKYRPMPVIEEIVVFAKNKVKYNPQMILAEDKNKRPRGKSNKALIDSSQGIASGEYKVSNTHNENLRYPKNLLTYNSRKGELNSTKRLHATQKPVEMIEWLIKSYSSEGDLVLDSCIGSGTTVIACLNAKRNYIGFELDEYYYNLANNRIKLHKEELKHQSQ